MPSFFDPKARATVLVVDDTPDNLSLMAELLKTSYRIKLANDGEKALRVAHGDEPPDLILLDIMMPGMNGHEVLRRLKADPRSADIPVIFLTAVTDADNEEFGLALGAVWLTVGVRVGGRLLDRRAPMLLQKVIAFE